MRQLQTHVVDGHPGDRPARPDELGPGLGHVLVDEVLPLEDDMLPLPVLDHAQHLGCYSAVSRDFLAVIFIREPTSNLKELQRYSSTLSQGFVKVLAESCEGLLGQGNR